MERIKDKIVRITKLNEDDAYYSERNEIYATTWVTGDDGKFYPLSVETYVKRSDYLTAKDEFEISKKIGCYFQLDGLEFHYTDSCPVCHSRNLVVTDHHSLSMESTAPDGFGLDTEIYADWKCRDCNATGTVVGEIKWGNLELNKNQ